MIKSYWRNCAFHTEGQQAAVRSWFAPLCDDDMTVESARILCDIETDDEKKLEAVMRSKDGARFRFTRTTGRRFSIKRQPIVR